MKRSSKPGNKAKILFLVTSITESAGDRLRVGQYLSYLEQNGLTCRASPLFSLKEFCALSRKNQSKFKSAYYTFLGLVRRTFHLLWKAPKYDIIFVRKQSLPYLPWFYLKILLALLRKPIIYDFDDATYTYVQPNRGRVATFLKQRFGKTQKLIVTAREVIAGNRHLAKYALSFNPNVRVIPTAVDTEKYIPCSDKKKSHQVVVGWIGTLATVQYLKPLIPVLSHLQKDISNLKVKVVCHPEVKGDFKNFEFEAWSLEKEPALLQGFDIGLMPLPDNPWTRGKSGFKILLYFSVGIPAVASPVGVNSELIKEGENGYLARTDQDWYQAISSLARDSNLRLRMGAAGRRLVESKYSLEVCAPQVLKTVRRAYQPAAGFESVST